MTVLAGSLAGYAGWKAGSERFGEVNELAIYSSKKEMFRLRHTWQTMGMLAYATPTMIRTFVAMTFLTGIPALVGVYRNDTDYVSQYVVSGAIGGAFVACLTTSKDFGGIRQKLVAALLAVPPALAIGCTGVLSQKYETYVHYDRYRARWRSIDPMWADYVERAEQEEALKALSSDVSPSNIPLSTK